MKEKQDCVLRASHGNVLPYSAKGEMKPFPRCLNSLAARVSAESCQVENDAGSEAGSSADEHGALSELH